MGEIVEMDALVRYKKVALWLQENNIPFDRMQLVKDPELCMQIDKLIDYCMDK